MDRSAAYYTRYVAKNIVAAGLSDKCEIQVAYAIGVAKPVSINIDTYGTAVIDESVIEMIVKDSEIFDFRPATIIENLNLTKPENGSYRKTSAYGHFGREMFPWEHTDNVDALKKASKMVKAA